MVHEHGEAHGRGGGEEGQGGETDVQGVASKVDEWRRYFRDRGLSAGDIPKALVVHEVIGLAWFASSWAVCYSVQPCRVLGSRLFATRSEQFFAAAQRRLDAWAMHIRRIPGLRAADKTRLMVSMAESSLVRNVARPVMIPLKIWLAYQAVALQASVRSK